MNVQAALQFFGGRVATFADVLGYAQNSLPGQEATNMLIPGF